MSLWSGIQPSKPVQLHQKIMHPMAPLVYFYLFKETVAMQVGASGQSMKGEGIFRSLIGSIRGCVLSSIAPSTWNLSLEVRGFSPSTPTTKNETQLSSQFITACHEAVFLLMYFMLLWFW